MEATLTSTRLGGTRQPASRILILALLLMAGIFMAIEDLATKQPVARSGDTLVVVHPAYGGYDINIAFAKVLSSPNLVSVGVPPDIGMPKPPNCRDLGLTEDCRWNITWHKEADAGSYDYLEVELQSGDKTVSEVQLLRLDFQEMPEVSKLTLNGHKTGWIGHVKVMQRFSGNGVGRLAWKAGDAALKVWAGAHGKNEVVRILSDAAGWGTALIRDIPASDLIWSENPVWVYILRRGG